MILKSIHVHYFRNFSDKKFEIDPHLTIIIGENARGKTNLLEAIFTSIQGVGFREWHEDELISWNENSMSIETCWQEGNTKYLFYLTGTKKNDAVEKKFAVNKVQKSHYEYGQFQTRAVLFAPEQIEIVTGSPDKRRSYFDLVISMVDKEYKKKLTNYEQALRKRNKVLEFHKNETTLKEELTFWDEYLEQQAIYVTRKRQEYADYLNAHVAIDHRSFRIEYFKNELSRKRLQAVFEQEKRFRKTSIGPQKDDFVIHLKDTTEKDVRLYGSRSEQRLAVFWFKLNEIRFLEETFKKSPILLLDDVFSELDMKNKALVLHLIKQYQSILTTTEDQLLQLVDMQSKAIRL